MGSVITFTSTKFLIPINIQTKSGGINISVKVFNLFLRIIITFFHKSNLYFFQLLVDSIVNLFELVTRIFLYAFSKHPSKIKCDKLTNLFLARMIIQ